MRQATDQNTNQQSQNSPQQNSVVDADESILDVLRKPTEYKEPGKASGPAWDFNNTEAETDAPQEEKKAEGEPAAQGERKTNKIPDEVKKASAETATLMFDELLQMMCKPVLYHKHKKKFTEEEREAISEHDLQDKDLAQITDEKQQILKKKWDRHYKKLEQKLLNIPLSKKPSNDEYNRVYVSFYNYFKATDTALSPGWLMAFTFSSLAIDRGIEVFTD